MAGLLSEEFFVLIGKLGAVPKLEKTVSSTIRWTLARPLRASGMTQLLRRTLFLNTNIINNPESQTNLLQQKNISPGNHFSRPAKAPRVRGDKEGQGGSGGAEQFTRGRRGQLPVSCSWTGCATSIRISSPLSVCLPQYGVLAYTKI